jgi:hypothetical protein
MPNEDALKDQGNDETQPPVQDQEQAQIQDQAGGEDEQFDKDRALATIQKQRESEKTLAKQLKEAKAALEAYQNEERSARTLNYRSWKRLKDA